MNVLPLGRVVVAGYGGMVGQALVRRLRREGRDLVEMGRNTVDFTDQAATYAAMRSVAADTVIVAAAKVGGIHANNAQPHAFLHDNLLIAANIMEGAHRAGINRLLFLGSSCIYPRDAAQPIAESSLLTGSLEPTNEWYAIAKIAGIKLAQAYRRSFGRRYISAMPTNLFGPGDNYHPENSHVPAALLRRFHEAKVDGRRSVEVWGTGRPRREFLHVDDLADACLHLLDRYDGDDIVNVGTGSDISIGEFAALIAKVVGYTGDLVFDTTRPDGTPRKLLDVSKLTDLGWTARIPVEDGLRTTYQDFLATNAGS